MKKIKATQIRPLQGNGITAIWKNCILIPKFWQSVFFPTLLPWCDRYYDIVRDVRQNKGSILKASVDYIRKLKVDQQKKRLLEERVRTQEIQNRKLLLKLQVRTKFNSFEYQYYTCVSFSCCKKWYTCILLYSTRVILL